MFTVMERAVERYEKFSARAGDAAAMPTLPFNEIHSISDHDGAFAIGLGPCPSLGSTRQMCMYFVTYLIYNY